MDVRLKKRPKNPIIIHGFPSIGLVSTISTKFLIDHLDIEVIGSMHSEHIPPLAAIHKSEIVDPITLYYNKKYNLLIVQSLSEIQGQEWETSKALTKLSQTLQAKENIVIEGMPAQENKVDIYHYSTKSKVIGKTTPLKEGVIGGLTATLLLDSDSLPLTCLFAQAHENMPDTEAAAKVIDTLNDYLGLDLDTKPLINQAKKFEHNLKSVLKQAKEIKETKAQKPDRETIDYLG
jgi:uncharacterized protein